MSRYERLRAYLFELEKYRDKYLGEIRPSIKSNLNTEITQLRIFLYNYKEETETEKREARFGFAVDNRINKAYLLKRKSQKD